MKLAGTLKVRIKSLKLFQVKICSYPKKVVEECTIYGMKVSRLAKNCTPHQLLHVWLLWLSGYKLKIQKVHLMETNCKTILDFLFSQHFLIY